MTGGFHIASETRQRHSEVWRPTYGERNLIPDRYNEMDVTLAGAQGRSLLLQVRAYDEGIALRYGVTEATTVEKEITDRKSTRLNSSHLGISYAVFCLKKK